jgi:hypothetical protein
LRIVCPLPLFILLTFMLAAVSGRAEEHPTHLSTGTLQMTGRGAAEAPVPAAGASTNSARRGAPANGTRIPLGTLQMTGRSQANQP